MAMNADTLGLAIAAAVTPPGAPETTVLANQQSWKLIAAQIIQHLQSSAVILPTALIAPSGGGPVTGVGRIT